MYYGVARRFSVMKTVLSLLLGMILLTSLIGFSYATPMQPTQSNNNNNNACPPNSYYNPTNPVCHSGDGGGHSDPGHGGGCSGAKALDGCGGCGSINPNSPKISRIQPVCF